MVTTILTALACLKLGAAIVPLDERENPEKVDHVFRTARAKLVIWESDTGAELAAKSGLQGEKLSMIALNRDNFQDLRTPSPDSIWSIEPTSGSSGQPKLVPLSAAVLDHYIEAHATAARLGPDDRVALFGEMWFDTIFSNFWAGTQAHFYDLRGKGSSGLVEWLTEHQITGFQSYPVAFRSIVGAAKHMIPSLRFARLSGEALLPSDVAEFERVFPEGAVLTNSYGSTECGLLACFDFPKGSTAIDGPLPAGFPPLPGELTVVDEAGEPFPQGGEGVIVKRSRFLAEHYLHNPEKTEGVYWTEPDGTRVLYTGDLGFFDADGCLHLIGRVDDQVKIRGYSVRYSEVEAEVSKAGGFRELAVTSWQNPQGARQLVCHFVHEMGNAFDTRAFRDDLLNRIPAYMVPNYFFAHSSLPKTESGKIKRKALPTPEAEGWNDELDLETLAPIQRDVAEIWETVLGHRAYSIEDDFFDVGGDSLQAMSVLVALEDRHKERLGYESFVMQGATIKDIAHRIENAPREDMVPLKQGRSGPPVFVLPVENGEFSDWLYMMNALGEGRSYYGVHVRDVAQRETFARKSIKELAEYACDTIERAHGLGPMVIAGFSAGTLLAIEVTRELQRRGALDVALVVVEPTAPHLQTERLDWWLRRIMSPLIKQGDIARMFDRAAHILLNRPCAELPVADETAFRSHTPKPLNVESVLMYSCEEENPRKADNERYWQGLLGDSLEILDAAGNHVHVMRDPNAARLGQSLETWISNKFT